jgi:DNA invertase Pin-like site-specific DNA recombinase
MPTAYSYIRFSTRIQGEGDSQRRQLAATQAYCDSNELTLSDKRFSDLGISAFKEIDRPSLADMLSAIETNIIKAGDYIILENLDRLSRKGISDTLAVLNSILKHEVYIVSLQDNLKLNKYSKDELISLIRIAVSADIAYQESKKKSDRIQESWNEKQREAITNRTPKTRICPAWLKLSDDCSKYEVIEDKALIVQRIFEMLSNGIGRRKIVSIFNQEKVPHISEIKRTSGTWHPSYIAKITKSGAVIGRFTPTVSKGGKRQLDTINNIEDYFPRVIEDSLYYQVQELTKLNSRSAGRKGAAFTNVLQGVCFCLKCNSVMKYTNKKKGEQFLECYGRSIGLCNNNMRYRYGLLEYAVLESIGLKAFKFDEHRNNSKDYDSSIDKLKGEIARVQENINVLTEQQNLTPFKDRLTKLSSDHKSKSNQLEELESERVKGELDSFGDSISYSTLRSDVTNGDIRIRTRFNHFLKSKIKLYFGYEQQVVEVRFFYFLMQKQIIEAPQTDVWMRISRNKLEADLKVGDEEYLETFLKLVQNGSVVKQVE